MYDDSVYAVNKALVKSGIFPAKFFIAGSLRSTPETVPKKERLLFLEKSRKAWQKAYVRRG
jgi:hypothetical protein